MPQRRHERHGLPGAERHPPDHPFAPRSAAKQPGHVGVHRCLINEDKVGGIKQALARVSIAGGRELRPSAPARQREGLFFDVTA